MSGNAKRPPLPRHLYRITIARSMGLIAYAAGSFVLPALGVGMLVALEAPLWIQVLLLPPLIVTIVHGGHMLGFVGHEGIHQILHPNKWVSTVLGSFLAAMTSFPAVGYGISHWNHHRYTNQPSDPDALVFPRFRSLCSRIFLSRIAANRSYLRYTLRAAFGRPLPVGYKLPFSAGQQQALALLNLGFLGFWVSVYVALALAHPLPMLFAIGIPFLLLFPVSGLRAYVEHAGTEVGMFRDSRSYASRLYTLLFFGNNFHLEHHLYPAVPCYNLPQVHRYLHGRGLFEHWDSHIDHSVLGPYVHATGRSQYPAALGRDLDHDPFSRETSVNP